METIRLENLWEEALIERGWSDHAASVTPFSLAKSTRNTYNKMLIRMSDFCERENVSFLPQNAATMANFLCEVAEASPRPKSILATASAAASCVYEIFEMENIAQDKSIIRLNHALTKTQSESPRIYTEVMPIEPFRDLFRRWPENEHLDIRRLRIKTLTLLALACMLRPSDVRRMVKFSIGDITKFSQ